MRKNSSHPKIFSKTLVVILCICCLIIVWQESKKSAAVHEIAPVANAVENMPTAQRDEGITAQDAANLSRAMHGGAAVSSFVRTPGLLKGLSALFGAYGAGKATEKLLEGKSAAADAASFITEFALQKWLSSLVKENPKTAERLKALLDAFMEFSDFRDLVPSFFNAAKLSSPIVINLNGDGIKTLSLQDGKVHFDLDANGFAEKTG